MVAHLNRDVKVQRGIVLRFLLGNCLCDKGNIVNGYWKITRRLELHNPPDPVVRS